MSIRPLVFCIFASAIVACGDDPPNDLPSRDGGGDAGDAGQDGGRDASADVGPMDGSQDGGVLDTGGPDGTVSDVGPSTPITERPSSGAYSCRVDRGRTDHSPKMWGNGLSLAVTSGGVAHFARLESSPPGPFEPAPVELLVSTFAADGTFGTSVEPSVGDPETMSAPVLTPKGDGTALAWIAGADLRFATLSSVGQPVITERSLPAGGTIDYQSRPRLAAGPASGVGIVYSVVVGSDRAVRFLGVDATGAAAGASVLIAGSGAIDPAAAIAAAADGYAVVWRDSANNRGRISFSKVGPTGTVIVGPTVISGAVDDGIRTGGGVGFDRPTIALLADGDGYVVAWPESAEGDLFGGSGAWSQIKIARLDALGNVVVPPTILRTRTLEIDEVEPTLVHVDDRVAVLWGRGEHIYFCGGCYPDNRIDLLMIDPVTLDPVSNVVTLDTTGGGLMRREVAVLGSTLLVAYLETFHVHSTAGSATFVCE